LALSVVQSSGAWAAVLVGVAISLLGGLKHPIRAILWGWIISSLFGLTLLGIGQMLIAWVVASVINAIFGPVVDVAINNFIQTKVPPDIQGRVFSASEFLAQIPFLFTPLLAAYFGDQVFEPAMQAGGPLANTFAWLVGTGPGAGYGLMILLCGVGGTLVGLWGFLSPTIRNANENMPDIILPPPVGLVRKTQPFDASGKSITFMPRKAVDEPVTFPKKQK
jgi:MFS transporter, DHA3 family, macrolide efflux protein